MSSIETATATPVLDELPATQQARSRALRERILTAAEEVISRHGFEQASIADIAKLAGCSVGSIYVRIGDKDKLLACLYERACSEWVEALEELCDPKRWQGASLEDIVAATVQWMVAIQRESAGLTRAFIARGINDPEFSKGWDELIRTHVAGLTRLLLSRRSEITHPNPRYAVKLCVWTLEGLLDELVFCDSDEREFLSLSDKKLPREVTRLLLSYLTGTAG